MGYGPWGGLSPPGHAGVPPVRRAIASPLPFRKLPRVANKFAQTARQGPAEGPSFKRTHPYRMLRSAVWAHVGTQTFKRTGWFPSLKSASGPRGGPFLQKDGLYQALNRTVSAHVGTETLKRGRPSSLRWPTFKARRDPAEDPSFNRTGCSTP